MPKRLLFVVLIALALQGVSRAGRKSSADASAHLDSFETKYYVIHTDINEDDAREAAIRMTKMAEEYHERTRDFSGTIRAKLPFYLFKTEAEYLDAGGIEGSAGVFTGSKLMAIAGEQAGGGTWHVVQHEGFHQFAAAVIGGDLPIWVNEGLAEYFGEGLFTGDGFVTGIIPQWRLARVRKMIDEKKSLSVPQMMLLSHEQWNDHLSIFNYDQAWSMVHFLAHGENGKYQKAFTNFMLSLNKGKQWTQAWQDSFGDAKGFDQRWRTYWLELPDDPTADRYAMATTNTLASFLARATSQKQTFASFDAFAQAAEKKQLKAAKDDWLPPSLLDNAMEEAKKSGKWSIITPTPGKPPQLICEMEDGTRLAGSFALRSEKIERVGVEIDDTPKKVAEARKLIDKGKKDQAKAVLQDAIKRNPKSPVADEARKMMPETK